MVPKEAFGIIFPATFPPRAPLASWIMSDKSMVAIPYMKESQYHTGIIFTVRAKQSTNSGPIPGAVSETAHFVGISHQTVKLERIGR